MDIVEAIIKSRNKMEKFIDRYLDNYDFLYENEDNYPKYDEAMSAGDAFRIKQQEFMAAMSRITLDYITSDREAAALGLTLADYGIAAL